MYSSTQEKAPLEGIIRKGQKKSKNDINLRGEEEEIGLVFFAYPVPFYKVNNLEEEDLLHGIVHATATETDQPKWWEKNGPNMLDIHSTQEFVDFLGQAGDRLVIVDFYGTWCASCRALFPKLCKLAEEHPEILFLKVNFDENKSLCKSLNIRVLPYFHFYRGADRLLDSFSCSLAKIQKLKDAIAAYNVTNCSGQISLKDNEDGNLNQPTRTS